eukprot:125470-Hanusia_phi.AAC.3
MGQKVGLSGQRLVDLLAWPLQRSMRYLLLLRDLAEAAAGSHEPHQTFASSAITPKLILDVLFREQQDEASQRQQAQEIVNELRRMREEESCGMVEDLPDVIEVYFRVKDETRMLNNKVQERQSTADFSCPAL